MESSRRPLRHEWLTWADVDLDDAVAHVSTTKNGQPRVLPLVPAVVEELKRFKAGASSLIAATHGAHRALRPNGIALRRDGSFLLADLGETAGGVFALVGAVVGLITAHALGAESQLISAGLLGFNPVLTAIALGAVFYRPSFRVVVYTLLATVLSVIVQGAMITAMTPFGIPTLTASFVLVTWLFLLPGLKFE